MLNSFAVVASNSWMPFSWVASKTSSSYSYSSAYNVNLYFKGKSSSKQSTIPTLNMLPNSIPPFPSISILQPQGGMFTIIAKLLIEGR